MRYKSENPVIANFYIFDKIYWISWKGKNTVENLGFILAPQTKYKTNYKLLGSSAGSVCTPPEL
jgi:hypothetical protein